MATAVSVSAALFAFVLIYDHAQAARRQVQDAGLRQGRFLATALVSASERLSSPGTIDAVQEMLDVGADGKVLASNRHDWIGRDESVMDDKEYRRLAYTARSTRQRQEDGAEGRSILVTPMETHTGGLLYVRIDDGQRLEALSSSALKRAILSAFVAMALGLCAWQWTAAVLARPAREMATYLRAAAGDGAGPPPPGVTLPREMALIENEFGRMGAEVRRLRAALRVAERQRLEAQRMESVASLAGAVAHDLNNLLTGILGYGRLLLDRVGPGDPIRRQLAVIENSASRAAELTGRLLTFSRRVAGRPEPTDLGASLAATIESVRGQLAAGTDLVLRRQEDLWPAAVDASQIGRVLLALCANARDAMPCGGRLTIEMENHALTANDCRGRPEARPGRFTTLRVADTGAGDDPELRRRLFEPSLEGGGPADGADSGLAIVYGLVKGNDGWIEVQNQPGYGTRFTVFLPACEQPAAAASREGSDSVATRPESIAPASAPAAVSGPAAVPAQAAYPPGEERRGVTILAVDDESTVLALAKDVLEMHGYGVLTARNGEEALRVYRTHREEIALVLLDLTMPVMGGRECFQELRRIDPKVRVVISSGFSSESSASELLGDGALDYLQKPYDIDTLARAVNAALNRQAGPDREGARRAV
jgi:signal transduction histidine kinase/ActR/RegA family two-component response regulator